MSYPGWVSVLLNSVAALAIAFFVPRIVCPVEPASKARMSWWVYMTGFALIGLSSWRLFSIEGALDQTIHSFWIAAAALAGTTLKWTLTVVASRGQSFHEGSLVKSLLVSPIGFLLLGPLLLECGVLAAALFWFANGFFWQAVFDDGVRIFSNEKLH